EVKLVSADGTANCGRVCRRLLYKSPLSYDKGLFFMTKNQGITPTLGIALFDYAQNKLIDYPLLY
ncbi:hypothetical protein ACFFFQ_00060, partial [Mesonia mobilis]|uniref:hypothetical protein n=1 Tax=Mesonia mobilis TaxID=369791 RepID=UPI0035ED1B69